ncbi:MAG: DNA pilot protein [Arizlama microvirus]|nr:MAG: DNA pilot protein [Arizlama microvirus]
MGMFDSIGSFFSNPTALAGGGLTALFPQFALPTLFKFGSDFYNMYRDKQNFDLQSEQLHYQQALQGVMFGREDNSVQRRVADLRAAGLSPTLAAGSSAQAGPVVQTHAPQYQNNMSDQAMGVMSLLKMASDISTSQVQRDLIASQKANTDTATAIKKWDLSKYVEANQASNASGLAKTVRDIFNTSQSPVLKPVINGLAEKLKPQGDKKLYKSPYPSRQGSDAQRLYNDLKNIFK